MFDKVLNTPLFNNFVGRDLFEFERDIVAQDCYLYMSLLGIRICGFSQYKISCMRLLKSCQ